MKSFTVILISALLVALMAGPAVAASDEYQTEITGFYQQYRNFSYSTGIGELDMTPGVMKGGGFSVAQNLAPWFAMWTQFSFYGSLEQENMRVGVINNQQGIRYQTRQYGPLRFYGKGGLGFSRYSVNAGGYQVSDTKFSLAYGGGVHIWVSENFGLVLDGSHVIMGLPNLTDLAGRERWDSGMVYTAGLTVRF
ncbi:MAG TPA: outer membrane beta-barrel protein [Acidobacteriota bacterium]|nr:outer membrane beta-barrel protein [Acidobacteriota bacterium]